MFRSLYAIGKGRKCEERGVLSVAPMRRALDPRGFFVPVASSWPTIRGMIGCDVPLPGRKTWSGVPSQQIYNN